MDRPGPSIIPDSIRKYQFQRSQSQYNQAVGWFRFNVTMLKTIFKFTLPIINYPFDFQNIFRIFHCFSFEPKIVTVGNSSAMDSQFLDKLTRIIQEKMTDSQFGVSELAREMGMSRSNLHRRVSEITGKTVIALISEARLKKALELLKEGLYTVSEVSWRAGFGSVTYFDKCFKDYYGFPPGEAKNRDLSKVPAGGKQNKEVTTVNHKKRNRILMGALSLILLATVVVVQILVRPFNRERKEIEKSIAVLPFINDSPDSNDAYINGVMESILNKLSNIKALRVPSRTTVEQYRNNKTKTVRQIARELDVDYIVEGSGQKYGDQVMLSLQLIDARTDKHLLSERYTRKWEDIFTLESEIATLIAIKIKAEITPEEAELVIKRPTDNIDAYNAYLLGHNLWRISIIGNDKDLLPQVKNYLRKAIQLDSTFAFVYVLLGWIVQNENPDSALILSERALHFDNKNPDAYDLKGCTFMWHSNGKKLEQAEDDFKLAIKYNPNLQDVYNHMGSLYIQKLDYFNCFVYDLKCLNLVTTPYGRWFWIRYICGHLDAFGLFEEELLFAQEIIKFNNDSLFYYRSKIRQYKLSGDYSSACKTALTAVMSNKWPEINLLTLADICMFQRDYLTALKHVEEYIRSQGTKVLNSENDPKIGYIFLKNGQKEMALHYFKNAINDQQKLINEGSSFPVVYNYLNLAWVYSAMGEKDKALENLAKAAKCKEAETITLAWYLIFYENDPMYDTIRDEPEFIKFFQRMEDNYQADREKVKKLFREAGVGG